MRLVFTDIETGGLDFSRHPVTQIAAVAVDEQLAELAAFEAKIDFDLAAADPEALLKNSYDAAAWDRESKPSVHVVDLFSRFLKTYADVRMVSQRTGNEYFVAQLVGHNALTFDGPFLQAFYKANNAFMPASYRVMDTCQRAQWHFFEHPDQRPPPDFKLPTLCEFFGVALENAHDALADVRATVGLYRALKGLS
jgi:DNA polymerase-3 subunit epsilon